MDTRTLGQTDLEISPIGLGCWQFSRGKNMTGREAHDATVSQVALAWLVTHYGDPVVAIPGASRPEQAAAAAAAMDVGLTQAEMASIDAVSAAIATR